MNGHDVKNIYPAAPRGGELIATMPEGVVCVAMTVFDGVLVLCTSHGVYRYDGEVFRPIPLVHVAEEAGKA